MKRFIKPLIVLAVVAFAIAGIHNIVTTKQQVQLREVELKSTTTKLNDLQLRYDKLNTDLDKALHEGKTSKEQLKKLQDEKADLERQKQELEKQVSAKAEAKRLAASKLQQATSISSTASAAGNNTAAGGCEAWFAAAGITGSELANARELMRRENAGCDPQKYNMGGSDACGVAQELPCGKSGCGMPPNADGACQVKWQKQYVANRYGGYAGAIAWHNAHNWY